MSKATDAAMAELHGELAKALKAGIYNEDGTINTAAASVARQFLKDNHIEVGQGAKPGALQGLADLPEFAEDGNVVALGGKR